MYIARCGWQRTVEMLLRCVLWCGFLVFLCFFFVGCWVVLRRICVHQLHCLLLTIRSYPRWMQLHCSETKCTQNVLFGCSNCNYSTFSSSSLAKSGECGCLYSLCDCWHLLIHFILAVSNVESSSTFCSRINIHTNQLCHNSWQIK